MTISDWLTDKMRGIVVMDDIGEYKQIVRIERESFDGGREYLAAVVSGLGESPTCGTEVVPLAGCQIAEDYIVEGVISKIVSILDAREKVMLEKMRSIAMDVVDMRERELSLAMGRDEGVNGGGR